MTYWWCLIKGEPPVLFGINQVHLGQLWATLLFAISRLHRHKKEEWPMGTVLLQLNRTLKIKAKSLRSKYHVGKKIIVLVCFIFLLMKWTPYEQLGQLDHIKILLTSSLFVSAQNVCRMHQERRGIVFFRWFDRILSLISAKHASFQSFDGI